VSPYLLTAANFKSLISITATDNFTVVFKWSTSNPEFIYETLESTAQCNCIENPEAVQEWGNLSDWHHAIGTGPFILNDFVEGVSLTLVKNPDYWGYDERYPQNKLPYIDKLEWLVIPDPATAMTALRSGKIDMVSGTTLLNAQDMQETNPKILQVSIPGSSAWTIDPRDDKAPFNDIRVREALQEAIDLPTIAKTYYSGYCYPYPSTTLSANLTGWAYTYKQWPSALQSQYAYNPTEAKALLAAAGYPNGFNTDIVASNSDDLDLLQIVKGYFQAIDVNMSIQTMDKAAWVKVTNGGNQDQLAYAQELGLAVTPFTTLTHWLPGVPGDVIDINDPVYNAFYTNAVASTNIDDIQKIVIEQQEYCAQQQFDISLLVPDSFDLYWPWLKGYSGQNTSIRAGSTGPGRLGFYAARFWIDQNMKHNMGY
jgi:peptide/nickel transport system substrate-binding protein